MTWRAMRVSGSGTCSTKGCALAYLAVFVALFPGMRSVWQSVDGGTASRTWSFGVPGSPLLTIEQAGQGSYEAVSWSWPGVVVHPFSVSFLFLVGFVALRLVAFYRGRRSPISGRVRR
jgi:hypothetical protein